MYSNVQLSELIGLIYEGASDPANFQIAMRRFRNLSEAHVVFFAVIDGASGSIPETSMIGPETSSFADASDLMQNEMFAIDPGLPFALARPEGGVFKLADATSELTPELGTWRDFIRHDCGSSDYHSRFSPQENNASVVLAMHADAGRPAISGNQEALHSIVFDHFQRAARLAYHPPKLSEQNTPAVLVDARRNIVEMNASADTALSATDSLIVRGGKLYASHGVADKGLAAALAAGCSPTSLPLRNSVVIDGPDHHPPLLLSFQPIPVRSLGTDNPSFLCRIEIRGGESETGVPSETLRLIFGLTRREAEVASLLAGRYSDLPSIAHALGMGYETARSHLRAVYSKCRVSNQVELVRLLARYR